MTPRFSIIITCYNQRDFIVDAVDSALGQSQGGAEIIVVDDHSSDGSWELLSRYRDRVSLVRAPNNGGPARARNHGASLASGQYLVFLDGDDALMAHALAVYDRVIEHKAPALMLASVVEFSGQIPSADAHARVDGALEIVAYPNTMAKDRSFFLSSSATVVDRQVLLDAGGWSPDIWHGDNKDFLMKLGCAGPLILILEPTSVFYRVHSTNSIHDVASYMAGARRLIAKEKAGFYPGGDALAFARRASLGMFAAYWSMKGLAAGHWVQALSLILGTLPFVIAAVRQRSTLSFKGRQGTMPLE